MKYVDGKDISVVIQGPLFRQGHHQEKTDLLLRAIASIRHYLKDAEIIISTWQTEDVSKLTDVVIIQSEDFAPFVDCRGDRNNVNRQLLSTKRGMEAATRPYVLKFRADHYLTGIEMMRKTQHASELQYSFLSAPITISNLFIRNPLKFPYLFHISDLIMFGKREDMLDFWQQPLVEAAALFMTKDEQSKMLKTFQGPTLMRCAPEQSLMLGWLAKHGVSIHLPHRFHTTMSLFTLWEKTLIANFHILDFDKSGIGFPPRFLQNIKTMYTEKDISVIKTTQGKWQQKFRYAKLWLNKYFLNCFRFRFILIMLNHLIYMFSPNLEKKLTYFYRKLKRQ